MIRVVVADDYPVVRHGLCAMLEADDIRVVGQAADGAEAIAEVRRSRPDVVLLDVQMPVIDGLQALRIIRRDDPATRVVVLTTYQNDPYWSRSLEGGARACLPKDTSRLELTGTIRAVAAGRWLLDPAAEVLTRPRLEPRAGESVAPELTLTHREAEVLTLMGEQQHNAQIARRLFISENTVKTHVRNILAKLGCGDRSRAVLTAWKRGIIQVDR